jgi:hypothetical protein
LSLSFNLLLCSVFGGLNPFHNLPVVPAGNMKSFYLIGYLEVKQIQAHCVADVEKVSFLIKYKSCLVFTL